MERVRPPGDLSLEKSLRTSTRRADAALRCRVQSAPPARADNTNTACSRAPQRDLPGAQAITGEVPEWLNGLVSKTSVSFGAPGVQIPPSPPPSELNAHGNGRVMGGGVGSALHTVVAFTIEQVGEVSERLNEHAWKACVSATAPGVRIPPSPPFTKEAVQCTRMRRASSRKSRRARRWARSHAVGRVRTGSGRERSSPKGLESSARCPGPPAGSPFLAGHGYSGGEPPGDARGTGFLRLEFAGGRCARRVVMGTEPLKCIPQPGLSL